MGTIVIDEGSIVVETAPASGTITVDSERIDVVVNTDYTATLHLMDQGMVLNSGGIWAYVNSEISSVRTDTASAILAQAQRTDTVTATVNSNYAEYQNTVTSQAGINSSTASDITILKASTSGFTARLDSTDEVVSGQFDVWDPANTVKIGNIKFIEAVQYQYLGGTLGENSDGWVRTDQSALAYAGTVESQLDRVGRVHNGAFDEAGPAWSPIKGDLWVSDDEFYTEYESDGVTPITDGRYGDNNGNFPKIKKYTGSAWSGTLTYEESRELNMPWAGGSSKLLTGPDGSITGWSFGAGSNVTNEFKIKADRFVIEDSGTRERPFVVENGNVVMTGSVYIGGKPSSTLPIFYGSLAVIPTARPDGTNRVEGDSYQYDGSDAARNGVIFIFANNNWVTSVGDTPDIVQIHTPGGQIFVTPPEGAVNPSEIVLSTVVQGIDPEPVDGDYQWYKGDTAITNATNSSHTIGHADVPVGTTVTYKVVVAGIQDEMTLAHLKDGINAITVLLSNEAHSVGADTDGSNPDLTGAYTDIYVYNGISDDTADADSITWAIVEGSGTISLAGTAGKETSCTVTAMTTDTLVVKATVDYAGSLIDKMFSVSKSKTGVQGIEGADGNDGLAALTYVGLASDHATDADKIGYILNVTGRLPKVGDTIQYTGSSTEATSTWRCMTLTNDGEWAKLALTVNGDILLEGSLWTSGNIQSTDYTWPTAAGPTGFKLSGAGAYSDDGDGPYNIVGGNIYGGSIDAHTIKPGVISNVDTWQWGFGRIPNPGAGGLDDIWAELSDVPLLGPEDDPTYSSYTLTGNFSVHNTQNAIAGDRLRLRVSIYYQYDGHYARILAVQDSTWDLNKGGEHVAGEFTVCAKGVNTGNTIKFSVGFLGYADDNNIGSRDIRMYCNAHRVLLR